MSSEPGRTIGNFHFLIVEDNEFTAIVVNKTLESLGATRIATAKTGRQALELIEAAETPPDVLLIDLRMLEMGGVELIGRLGDRRYPGHVIVTSGVDAETLATVEALARDSGVQVAGCLSKPLDAVALSELLDRILQ